MEAEQPRRRAAHLGPERRRPLVLDAALEVFAERGYSGTTMQSVADAAGVTKPVVYDCFPNRDELILALLAREEKKLVIQVMSALPADPARGSLEDHVREGLTAVLEAVAKTPKSWQIMLGARDEKYGAAPAVADRVRAARSFVVDGLRLILMKALPGVAEPEILAELLASMTETCARMLVTGETDRTPAELATVIARVVSGGFAAV